MSAYYNEIDPYAAEWLGNLIAAGHIAAGEVDTRSIVNVQPDDVRDFTQCHFFAGIGGWAYAARLVGWPDDRELWTGSCPCQPFSTAGKGKAQADERHLWPELFRLTRACRPAVLMGEQVAAAVGKHWLDGVFDDLESARYACHAAIVPACAVDAPHRRERLWFVADAHNTEQERQSAFGRTSTTAPDGMVAGRGGPRGRSLADTERTRLAQRESDTGVSRSLGRQSEGQNPADDDSAVGDTNSTRTNAYTEASSSRRATGQSSRWASAEQLACGDGKVRRVEPGIRLLVDGIPTRVGRLRAYGNAIVPQVAAEVIAAFMECRP